MFVMVPFYVLSLAQEVCVVISEFCQAEVLELAHFTIPWVHVARVAAILFRVRVGGLYCIRRRYYDLIPNIGNRVGVSVLIGCPEPLDTRELFLHLLRVVRGVHFICFAKRGVMFPCRTDLGA